MESEKKAAQFKTKLNPNLDYSFSELSKSHGQLRSFLGTLKFLVFALGVKKCLCLHEMQARGQIYPLGKAGRISEK
jgi:hypothetical protein